MGHAASVYYVDISACKPTEGILSLSTKGLGWRSFPGTDIWCQVGVPEAEISSGDRQIVREGLLQQNDKPFITYQIIRVWTNQKRILTKRLFDSQPWYEKSY